MKNYKALLSFFAIIAFATSATFAQATQNGDVTVSASIIETIEYDVVSDLAFGNITASGTPTVIDPDPTGTALGTGQSRGIISIDATPGSSIIPTFSITTVSDLGGGTGLDWTPVVEGGETETGATGVITSAAAVTVAGSDDGSGNTYYIFVGGSLATDGVSAGSYSATYTVSIAYE